MILATGLAEVVIVKVSSIPCGKVTLVALVKVGAVSAANRGGAAKAMKMLDSRMAHVRTVQVRILLDGTWQEWLSIDKEFGRRYSRSYAKSSHYNTHLYKIGTLDSIDPGQGLVPRFAKSGNAMSASDGTGTGSTPVIRDQ